MGVDKPFLELREKSAKDGQRDAKDMQVIQVRSFSFLSCFNQRDLWVQGTHNLNSSGTVVITPEHHLFPDLLWDPLDYDKTTKMLGKAIGWTPLQTPDEQSTRWQYDFAPAIGHTCLAMERL